VSATARAGVKAVLFDLDGTLADTAADLAYAVNRQRIDRGLAPLPLAALRPHVSQGARGMLRTAFGIAPGHADYPGLRDEFLEIYAANLLRDTRLFEGIADLLAALEARRMPWGIVTNKLTQYTSPLIAGLGLAPRAGCIVCGDTCARAKPFPDPLVEAAARVGLQPGQCLYIGDDERDVQAAHAAGMDCLVAGYGYLGDGSPPHQWGGRAVIAHPREVLGFL
jgi:N-acetyl-D-muramate 6-phosphate phosphatase